MVAHAAASNRPNLSRPNLSRPNLSQPNLSQPSAAVARLLRALTLATAAMLLFLAVWLLIRRIGGQLRQPLGTPALTVVAVTLAGLASWLRVIWYHTGLRLSHWRSRAVLVWIFPSVVVLVLAIALSITGTGTVGLLFFWSILLVAEGAWWWFAWRQLRAAAEPTSTRGARASDVSSDLISMAPTMGSDEEIEPDEDDDQLPDDVSQQITRTCAEGEEDTVTGLLRARFEPSERSRSLHVAFCPPMPRPPKVTVIQLSGSRARIKAAETQPFGVRFDVRLANACQEEQEVLIHFEARCPKQQSAGLGATGPAVAEPAVAEPARAQQQ